MARRKASEPTEGELEILNILWERGPCELGAIRAAIQEDRPIATTTVATMLKVMLEKRLVSRRRGERAYEWSARVSQRATRRGLVSGLVERAFDGQTGRLVAHLFEDGKLSEADRDELRRLLGEEDDR